MLPLTTANLLPHVIVGSAFEQMDMERLIREVGHAVAERVVVGQESVDDIAKELHEKLLLRNESTKQLIVEDIYVSHDILVVYINPRGLTSITGFVYHSVILPKLVITSKSG